MEKREKELMLSKINSYNEAYRSGNFSKANAIKNELLIKWGIDGDFECTREPQR